MNSSNLLLIKEILTASFVVMVDTASSNLQCSDGTMPVQHNLSVHFVYCSFQKYLFNVFALIKGSILNYI